MANNAFERNSAVSRTKRQTVSNETMIFKNMQSNGNLHRNIFAICCSSALFAPLYIHKRLIACPFSLFFLLNLFKQLHSIVLIGEDDILTGFTT